MSTKLFRILILLLILFSSKLLFAQKVPPALQQRLVGKTRLVDIMREVDLFYENGRSPILRRITADGKEDFENDYIHWKRFEYFHASRLDSNGNVRRDIARKIWEGLNEYKASRLGAFSPAPDNFSYGSWTNYGPTVVNQYGEGWNSGYGRVNCIAFHPSDANTFYIGLPQGGIWRTIDGGVNWTVLTDDIPSTAVSGLVVNWANANIIYALTGDGDVSHGGFVPNYGFRLESVGVLKSTDGGANWSQTGTFPGVSAAFWGYKLIQHPTISSTLFAVTTNGIYRTTNSGTTWTQEQTGIFTDIEFKPGSPNTMYAVRRMTAGGGTNSSPLFRSTDGGASWSNAGITGLTSTAERLAIGVSKANSAYVYLLTGPSTGSGSFKGIFRSSNSGIDFTTRCTTPNILGYPTAGTDDRDQAFYDLCIEVDPDNVNTVITGGINIWRSIDGGTTMDPETQWRDDGPDVPPGDYVHADVHNLTYNPLNNYLYTCTDGGVARSTNNGATWTMLSVDLHIMATYHADWYEPDNNILTVGTQDNGINNRYTSSNAYRHIQGADGFDVVIDQNNPLDMVMSWNAAIVRTTDGGLTATSRTPTNCGTFPQLARSYSDDNDIFAADGSNVYRSTNRGTAWTTETTPAGSRVLTTCQSNSSRVYASNGSTAWRSDDAGDTWSVVSGTTGYPTGVNLTDIESRPSNSLIIWASFGGYSDGKKVYYSTNGGDTWSNQSGSLPNLACHSIAVDVNNSVYVGTDIGVFVRPSGETDWQPYLNGLPKTPVSELMVNNTAGTIVACTFGRGNWIDNIYSVCPPTGTLLVSGTITGNRFYEYNTISSNATITGGQGTNVLMKGVDNVNLTEGFEAKSGNIYKAYTGPCGSGGVVFDLKTIGDTLSMEKVFIAPENGKRWPYAHFTGIDHRNHTIEIKTDEAGIYLLRLVKEDGSLAALLSKSISLSKGVQQLNIDAMAQVANGFYYIQMFKGGKLVHFLEYIPE